MYSSFLLNFCRSFSILLFFSALLFFVNYLLAYYIFSNMLYYFILSATMFFCIIFSFFTQIYSTPSISSAFFILFYSISGVQVSTGQRKQWLPGLPVLLYMGYDHSRVCHESTYKVGLRIISSSIDWLIDELLLLLPINLQ